MTDQAEANEAVGVRRVRMDWRTGQAMVQHDPAFWRDHSEDVVCKSVLAQRLPEVLGGAQLRAVRRQEHHAHFQRHEFSDNVPAGLIHDHDNEFLGLSLRHLAQEE